MAFIRQIDDFDIWYHLVIGQRISETWRIPPSEFFVYPLAGQPASFHEWGFGLVFFAIHRWFGFPGMALVNAALGGAALLLLYRAGRRGGAIEAIYIAGLGAFAALVMYRVTYRPEQLLFTALAASIYVLERHLGDGAKRWLVAIPILTFVLSQGHPSAVLILFIVGCYGGQAIVNARAEAHDWRGPAARFAAAWAAGAVAAVVNPYGPQQLLRPFSFASEIQRMNIMEFTPSWSTGYRWPLVTLAVAGAAGALLTRGRRVAYGLVCLAFVVLAFRHVRNVAVFALVMYLPVTRGFDALIRRRGEMLTLRGFVATGAAAVLAIATTWAAAWHAGAWGAGPLAGFFPERAARTIEQLRPSGRIFNYYDMGGYLAWRLSDRGYQVSIDGRHYVRDRSLVLHDEVFFEGGPWRRRFESYDVAAVVTPAVSRFSGQMVSLIVDLDADPDWELACVEPAGLLFVQRGRLPRGRPFVPMDKDEVWRQAIREAGAVLSRFPDHAPAYQTLGVANFKLERWAEAADYFRLYLELLPGDRDTAEVVDLIRSALQGDAPARLRLRRLHDQGRGRAPSVTRAPPRW